MSDDDHAHAVLGLDADCSAEDVERAFRALMKVHHPDRAGGDSARASEIVAAYRTLKASQRRRDVVMRPPLAPPPRPLARSAWVALVAAVLLVAVTALRFVKPATVDALATATADPPARYHRTAMGSSLDTSVVDRAAREARDMVRHKGEIALIRSSRSCHEALRRDPTIRQFDRCAAFDAAAVSLLDRDPMRDKGVFGQLAVSGRAWSAAALVSDDNFATDSRLKAIEARVALVLADDGAL